MVSLDRKTAHLSNGVATPGEVVGSLDRGLVRSLGSGVSMTDSGDSSTAVTICDDDAEAGGGSGGVVLVSRSTRFSQLILTVFLAIWFAFGNYWVFNVYHKVRDAYVKALLSSLPSLSVFIIIITS